MPRARSSHAVGNYHHDPSEIACKSIELRSRGFRATRKALRKYSTESCQTSTGSLTLLLLQSAKYAEKHRLISLWWGRLHYILGLPAAILAAIAGTLIITNQHPRRPEC